MKQKYTMSIWLPFCFDFFIRILRSFSRLQEDPPAGVSGAPTDNNIMLWNAVIFG